MRASKKAWAVLLVCVAVAGALLLIIASVVSGQHAHGRWVQPARLIGLLLLTLGGFGLWLLLVVVRPQPDR
jgi:ABC-type enterobactin transport system permease subunit